MPRLPRPGRDHNIWGDLLNSFLLVEHTPDGSLKKAGLIQSAQQMSQKGQPHGYAPLNADAQVPAQQLPAATATAPGTLQLAGDLAGTATNPTVPELHNKEDRIDAGAVNQYFRGDKTWQPLTKQTVGLDNVDNTSDENKPVSRAAQQLIANVTNQTQKGILAGVHYVPAGGLHSQTVQNVRNFEAQTGGTFDVVSIYFTLSSIDFTHVAAILNAGYKVQLFLQINQAGNSAANLTTINSHLNAQAGVYYTQLVNFFTTLAADGRSDRVFLCILHEGNSNYYPWGVFMAGNSANAYVQAYRAIVTLARNHNVLSKFVQIYNVRNSGTIANQYSLFFKDMYAGDEYVDYVGIDDYNRDGVSYNYWAYPGTHLTGAYRQVAAMTHKPIIIGEFNSVPSKPGRSRADWLKAYAAMLMSERFSRVVMVTLFCEDKSGQGSGNWFIDSPEDIAAVGEMLKIFKARPSNAPQALRPVNANLLPADANTSVAQWGRVGAGTALATDTAIPEFFDTGEVAIKFSKGAITPGTPESFNFYYLPADVSWWAPSEPYILTFYGRATRSCQVSVGTRQHVSPFEFIADHFVEFNTSWQEFTIPINNSVPSTGGLRVPFFGAGRIAEAVDIFVAGLKLERGITPTSFVSKRSLGLANIDNTSDANKPISTATQAALNQKANLADVVRKTGDESVGGVKSFTADVHVAGQLGIGTTTPQRPLDVVGNVRTQSASGDAVQIVGTGSNNTIMRFYDDATERGAIYSLNGSTDYVIRSQSHLVSSANNSSGTPFSTRLTGTGFGIGATPTATLDVNGDVIRLRTSKTPISATDTGNAGDIAWDENYIYVCVAQNTWKRSALGGW